MSIVKDSLSQFGACSGLLPNLTKSSLFIAGVDESTKAALCEFMGIGAAVLPVKYLGIPLTTKGLKAADCSMLVEKISKKVDGWSAKCLSFAGRLVLINSTLFGAFNYWCQCVFLPKSIIDRIEQCVRRFLWSGKHEGHFNAKVAWGCVTQKKEEGGLGIKAVRDWNLACMSKHLWNICINKDTIWVRWIKAYRLKGRCVWSVEAKQQDSWVWKKLLELKEYIRSHFDIRLGNGQNANFLFDLWHPVGVLAATLDYRERSVLGIDEKDSVATALSKIRWPEGRQLTIKIVQCKEQMPPLNNDALDVVQFDGSRSFKTVKVWDVIRPAHEAAQWWKAVWFKGHIPKCSFTSWLACHDRLPTKNRLMQWGVVADEACVFCGQQETCQHLFFHCSFASALWRKLLVYMGEYHAPSSLASELQWILTQGTGKSFKSRLWRLCFTCAIYRLWRARNEIVFNNSAASLETTFNWCISTICNSVQSWRSIPRTRDNWRLCIDLGIPVYFSQRIGVRIA